MSTFSAHSKEVNFFGKYKDVLIITAFRVCLSNNNQEKCRDNSKRQTLQPEAKNWGYSTSRDRKPNADVNVLDTC